MNINKNKKKITRNRLKYNNVRSYGFLFCDELKNEFEIAVVNDVKVYLRDITQHLLNKITLLHPLLSHDVMNVMTTT